MKDFLMKKLFWLKMVLFILCLLPLAIIVWDGFQNNLTADPIEEILHRTGIWALRLLLVTLLMTPLKIMTKLAVFIRLRRMLGLFTFFYATLHLTTYLWLDIQFNWSQFFEDIIKRPYITVGMAAWFLMLPMAITSNKRMVRKLGKNWKRLHRAIYLVILLACLHFLWLVKSDLNEPLIYSVIGLSLLFFRLFNYSYGKKPRNTPKTSQHTD